MTLAGTAWYNLGNPKEEDHVTKEAVESVLDKIRPTLVADGGDVELVDVKGGTVSVRLTGACGG